MDEPIDMLLWCPECGARHVDEGAFATKIHHTHACQSCGMVWRPAIVATRGVRFLPGFKNDVADSRIGQLTSERDQARAELEVAYDHMPRDIRAQFREGGAL